MFCWVAGIGSVAAEEAKQLLEETDADKDGQLGFDEVIAKTALWVGTRSAAGHTHMHAGKGEGEGQGEGQKTHGGEL